MRLTIPIAAAALGAAGLAAPALGQDADFTGAVDSDWFEGGNWNPFGVPTFANSAFVNNGFAATALLVNAGGSDIEVGDFGVGDDSGGAPLSSLTGEVDIRVADDFDVGYAANVDGLSTGRVDLTSASVTFTNDSEFLRVGRVSGLATNSFRSAMGVLNITDGSIFNVENLEVGQTAGDGGEAIGTLTVINGDIVGTNEGSSSDFYIGRTSNGSNATGTVRVENGSITGFGFIRIGTSSGDGGVGDGTLELIDSVAAFGSDGASLVVGSVTDATGRLDLERSFLSSTNANWSDGATVRMTLDGLTRSADGLVGAGTYSAIDFDDNNESLINDTTLEIEFTFGASVGDTFDLIRLAQGQFFDGTLFDEINVTGLAGGLGWTTEVVPGTATAGEIYRLTVVPTPGAIALLGLAGLGAVRRRR